METPLTAPPPKTSKLAVAALLIGVVALAVVPLVVVSVALGIVALVKKGGLRGKGYAIAALCLAPLSFVASPILSELLFSPRFHTQERSKQSECKDNLKGLYQAERTFFQSNDRYSPFVSELGFAPDRGNRYAYLAGTGTLEDRSQPFLRPSDAGTGVAVDTSRFPGAQPLSTKDLPGLAGNAQVGVTGTCPACVFTAACVGQLDDDPTLDVWSISTADRTGPSGVIPAGTPYNDRNDITE